MTKIDHWVGENLNNLDVPCSKEFWVINAIYDLNTDHHEMNNLLDSNPESSKYKTKVEELKGFLLEWLKKTD